jgi:poly(hydroxyalkanoate) depolymerase family esterase
VKIAARLARIGGTLGRALQQAIGWLQDRIWPGPSHRDGDRPVPAARVPAARKGGDAAPRGRFISGRFAGNSRLTYMLYEPGVRKGGPGPLLVMLHGCRQDARDFATGTRMNEAAEEAGIVVLYPEQSVLANAMRCWNWYTSGAATGKVSEAAQIAALTRQVMRERQIDPARVYVAGMSAGGALAAVLAQDYPDLYAAVGIHSGLPAGLAHDLFSAMRLMFRGPRQGQAPADPLADGALAVPSIVFHGDEDRTVHLSNAQAIHSAAGTDRDGPSPGSPATTRREPGQRDVTRSVERGPGGVTRRELWIVHGAGHAWAGGDDAGSYTDADGPDASREMLRFFLQHRLAVPAAVRVGAAGSAHENGDQARLDRHLG